MTCRPRAASGPRTDAERAERDRDGAMSRTTKSGYDPLSGGRTLLATHPRIRVGARSPTGCSCSRDADRDFATRSATRFGKGARSTDDDVPPPTPGTCAMGEGRRETALCVPDPSHLELVLGGRSIRGDGRANRTRMARNRPPRSAAPGTSGARKRPVTEPSVTVVCTRHGDAALIV